MVMISGFSVSAFQFFSFLMVTFTRIPYATAASRARLQDRIVYGSLAVLLLIAALVMIRLIV